MPTSILATSDRRRRLAGGFTLIEVALVLLILAILLSFAAPRLMELTRVRREASAQRLAALLGYLHDEASLRAHTFRLTLDLDRSRYEVRMVSENGAFEPTVDPGLTLVRDEILPEGVRITAVETGTTFAAGGSVDLLFHPESDGASARLTLIDDSGGRTVVAFDGVTGHVAVFEEPPLRGPRG